MRDELGLEGLWRRELVDYTRYPSRFFRIRELTDPLPGNISVARVQSIPLALRESLRCLLRFQPPLNPHQR
jgi:hypothetical protein